MECKSQYSNIFGEPKKGIHSIRIFDIAIVDLGLTILASFIIAKYTKRNFFIIFAVLLALGLLLHKLFCVKTTLTNFF